MRFLVTGAVLGFAAIEAWKRVNPMGWSVGELLAETKLAEQKQRYLRGGIAAYIDFLNCLPVKGGESHS